MTLTHAGRKYEGLTKTKRTIDRMDVQFEGQTIGTLRGTPIGNTMKWTGFNRVGQPVTLPTNSQTHAAVQVFNNRNRVKG